MNLRNYIILKTENRIVHDVYTGPQETQRNIKVIASALDTVTRYLVKEYYQDGYDVIIARGQNLDSVKKSLPELHWKRYHSHVLTKFAEEVNAK